MGRVVGRASMTGLKTERAGNQHEMVGSTGQFDVLDSEEARDQGLS
jgi:hypothetical protein